MQNRPSYRGIFSWPKPNWITDKADSLGVQIIKDDIDSNTQMIGMVNEAVLNGEDETFGVFDMGVVAQRWWDWKNYMPDIQPFYAIKCHDDPAVISVLNYLGAGFDCASKGEIELALSVGVAPERIIFASPIKFPSHLRYAKKHGVELMTFDCKEELHKVKECYPEARLVLRLEVWEVGPVQYTLENKFGCSEMHAQSLLETAKILGLQVVGVSFHVGSGCSDAKTYIEHVKVAWKIFATAAKIGFNMSLLDIGGGFYGDTDAKDKLLGMKDGINATIGELFPKTTGVRVIAEPGRYFVESALTIVVCVIGKRSRKAQQINGENESQTMVANSKSGTGVERNLLMQQEPEFDYFVSESRYGSLACWFHYLTQLPDPIVIRHDNNNHSANTHPSILWGPTMDSADVIKHKTNLPELSIGDWLAFTDCGAYSTVVATGFNAIPPCTIQRVMRQTVWDRLIAL